jgi:hypothetical protein
MPSHEPRLGERPWCAKARYPGLREFIGGTVMIPSRAQSHEIEAALVAHFLTFLPPGFVIVEPVCGVIFFNSEADA